MLTCYGIWLLFGITPCTGTVPLCFADSGRIGEAKAAASRRLTRHSGSSSIRYTAVAAYILCLLHNSFRRQLLQLLVTCRGLLPHMTSRIATSSGLTAHQPSAMQSPPSNFCSVWVFATIWHSCFPARRVSLVWFRGIAMCGTPQPCTACRPRHTVVWCWGGVPWWLLPAGGCGPCRG